MKYEYYSLVQTAKMIKRDLEDKYPKMKFSVRSKRDCMTYTVYVRWNGGPHEKTIEKMLMPFKSLLFAVDLILLTRG